MAHIRIDVGDGDPPEDDDEPLPWEDPEEPDFEDLLYQSCEMNGPHVVGHGVCAACGENMLVAVPLWQLRPRWKKPQCVTTIEGVDCPECGSSSSIRQHRLKCVKLHQGVVQGFSGPSAPEVDYRG